jgi:hypothetical protein
MCAFTVNLIDLDDLTPAQKKALLKKLRKKKGSLQVQLRDVGSALKGVNRALTMVEKKKSKRRA